MNQIPAVAVTQFRNAEHTADANNQDAQKEAAEEDLDATAEGMHSKLVGAKVPVQVVDKEAAKSADGDDLKGESRKREVDAGLTLAFGIGAQPASAGLDDEGEEVAGDEDPVEVLGRETRQARGKVDNGVRQRDVDGSAEVDGRCCHADCSGALLANTYLTFIFY